MLSFEWDERKRRLNVEKHGLDFPAVCPAFVDTARVEFEDGRQDYGERRRVLLCPIAGRLVHVTYTLRGERRRIISARPASRLERRLYAQVIEATDPGDSE